MARPFRWPRRFKTHRVTTRGAAVYVIAAPTAGLFKIGRTANPQRRLAQLQSGSPIELKLMVQTFIERDGLDPIEMERWLHCWLKPYRSHGEWFQTTRQRIIRTWHEVAAEFLERDETDKLSHQDVPMNC